MLDGAVHLLHGAGDFFDIGGLLGGALGEALGGGVDGLATGTDLVGCELDASHHIAQVVDQDPE